MSTYYDFVCDKHRERTDRVCICRNFPYRWSGLYEDDLKTIRAFLIKHADCKPRLVSEHFDEQYEYAAFKETEEPK